VTQSVKNFLIGVFVTAACILVIWLILFLHPSVGDGKKTFHVRFANINQLSIGTRILFAGMPVGEVESIEELYDARTQPTDSEGQVYFFQLTLKVDSSVVIYSTDQIAIQTSGLLGEKSINIIPKAPPPGVTPILITSQPIYASSEDPITKTLSELGDLSKKIGNTIDDVKNWFDNNSDHISFAIQSFGCAMDQAYQTISDVNEQRLVDELKVATQNFNINMVKVHNALQEMEDAQVFRNVGFTMENMKNITHSIDLVTTDMAEGKGTLGRLLKSDEMYLRFTSLMSKADTMMNDINHYGLLFHLNKGWQRLRTQRATLMNALQSPSDFRNFFEQEIDQINTAMSRLSILIDKAEESKQKDEIMQSVPFKQDFSELLREVDALSDNLRLYNQQLMNPDSDKIDDCTNFGK
jgi:phospholipid/cholesterol/gamma-HCH transport system substrate-binding protein